MMTHKETTVWIVAISLGLALIFWFVGKYNAIVTADENVQTAWSQVETQYQRRSDLIPNLVSTVKGYATHEQETLEGVVEARARATQVTIDPTNATAEQLASYQAAQGELKQALGRLLMVAESYPELKANENFRDLQAQLEGTENRITVARYAFNEAAKTYNVLIRKFPTNLVAGMLGFETKAYFEADEGAEQAVKIEF